MALSFRSPCNAALRHSYLRAFVSVQMLPRRNVSDGWHQPGDLSALASAYEIDAELADVVFLQSLMTVGTSQERLEFVG